MKLVDSTDSPCAEAMGQGDGTWLVPKKAKLKTGKKHMTKAKAKAAVPKLDNPGHIFHGRRMLMNVPSGSVDLEVTDAGEVVQVHVREVDGKMVVVGTVAEVVVAEVDIS